MSDYFIGQIMMSGFGYAPKFFAQCNGQTMPIVQNQALFTLLGVTYGGNGSTTFQLPNLQGRTPNGQGEPPGGGGNYAIGRVGGAETVTLSMSQMPVHNHAFAASSAPGVLASPTTPATYAQAATADGGRENIYAPGASVPLLAAAVSTVGAGAPHSNMQPFQVINFNIVLSGVFPSRN